MIQRKKSLKNVLMNHCSMSGHRVLPSSNLHFYAATKFAVTALTQGLRNELQAMKSHIRVAVSLQGTVT